MKKIAIYMLLLVVFVLGIPTLALLGNDKTLQENQTNISNQEENSQNSTENQEIISQGDIWAEENNQEVVTQEQQSEQEATNQNLIKIYNHKTQQVMEMTINDYIKGVVCAEMPASYEVEAIKAQTVIAHTYTLRTMANEINNPTPELLGAYISTDYTKHQAYMTAEEIKAAYKDNYEVYYKKISDCVDEVINEILTYDDQPILATFHAVSGGKTEDAQNVWGQKVPYLVSTDSPEDTENENFTTTYTFTTEQVKEVLNASYEGLDFSSDASTWITILTRTTSDYVSTIAVLDKTLTGQEFRQLFGLKSANFTVSYENGVYTVVTKGYGHGVGLSQSGANQMALDGKKYNEILAHYYPNTVLTIIN